MVKRGQTSDKGELNHPEKKEATLEGLVSTGSEKGGNMVNGTGGR